MHRQWRELALEPPPRRRASLPGVYLEGWGRAPRTVSATGRALLEGGPSEWLAVLIAATILLGPAIGGIGALPEDSRAAGRTWLEQPTFNLVFEVAATALLWLLLMFGMSLVGDRLHQEEDDSGGGRGALVRGVTPGPAATAPSRPRCRRRQRGDPAPAHDVPKTRR